MASYLLVVGLVFGPTFIYLRTTFRSELRESAHRELEGDLILLRDKLNQTSSQNFVQTIAAARMVMPRRLTVIDPSGVVLGDSLVETEVLDNHLDRPEVRQALETGKGFSIRTSATTGEQYIYTALRVPETGPLRAIIRLALPIPSVDEAGIQGMRFVNQSAALALSAAVILSLIAAFVVSRPLQRLADAARAFSAGDFGHPLPVQSNDELGEAAQALSELASQLRGRLIAAGSDRAALTALVDDLPIGIILFDSKKAPLILNGKIRELLSLSPRDEQERVKSLIFNSSQEAAIQQVLQTGVSVDSSVYIPWLQNRSIRVRWVSLFASDGVRQLALIVLDPSDANSVVQNMDDAIETLSEKVYESFQHIHNPTMIEHLLPVVLHAESSRPSLNELPDKIDIGSVKNIIDKNLRWMDSWLKQKQVQVHFKIPNNCPLIIDASGRVSMAIRYFLFHRIENSSEGDSISFNLDLETQTVRISTSMRSSFDLPESIVRSLRSIGGDFGCSTHESTNTLWITLPRA